MCVFCILLYLDVLFPLVELKSSFYAEYCRTHLVKQYFTYLPRDSTSQDIADSMIWRQNKRLLSRSPPDKMCNPLITVLGAPGCGKSTFLVNFPASLAFSKYLNGKSVIVSTLSFTNRLEGTNDFLGLRIVFAVAISMGLIELDYPWYHFESEFQHFFTKDALEAVEAVKLLQSVIEADHRVLLLVDEISEAIDSKHVMKCINTLLSINGDCDVVMSVPSSECIYACAGGHYDREITQLVLPPLLEERLGQRECGKWALRLISQVGPDNIDIRKQRLLYNFYLMFSGHPRSLEHMCIIMNDNTRDWEDVMQALKSNNRNSFVD